MEILLYVILGIFIVGFSVIFWKLSAKKNVPKEDFQSMTFLQNQMNEVMRTLDTKLGETKKDMQEQVLLQFGESQKLIKEITQEITAVKETNKQVFGITEQLQNLEKVLKNQKQRGNLGEAGLELVLSNILPPTAYKLQYKFKDDTKPDAVIITKEGMVPIDAKFSLDNYNRIINETDEKKRKELEREFKNDLKKRIDETAKYIRPNEGTLPFALMFIPAEGIYYDLLVNEIGAVKVNTRSLIDYAYKDKSVIIVSPTTLVAYLQVILYGFRAFKIEQSAQEIIKYVESLSKHIKAYDDYFNKLGTNLQTTVNSYSIAYRELKKIDKDVLKISGEEISIKPLQVEGPKMEDDE